MGTEGKTTIIPAAVLDQVGGKLWVRIWAPSTEGFYRVGFSFVQYCQRQLERMEEFERLNRVSRDNLDHTCPQVKLLEEKGSFTFDPNKNRIIFSWDQVARFDFSRFLPTTVRHLPIYFVRKDGEVVAVWQGSLVPMNWLSEKERNSVQKGFDLSHKSPVVHQARLVRQSNEVKNEEVATTSGMFFF